MSNKFESTVREISYSQAAVYNTLSNLENLSKIKDRICGLLFCLYTEGFAPG